MSTTSPDLASGAAEERESVARAAGRARGAARQLVVMQRAVEHAVAQLQARQAHLQ